MEKKELKKGRMLGRDGHKVCTHMLRTNTDIQYVVKGHIMVSVSHTHTLMLHLMISRGAPMTQHLSYFFFIPLSSFSLPSTHAFIHSLRLLVNELLIRQRRDLFIRNRCALTHTCTTGGGYSCVSINLFTCHFPVVCPHLPSHCLSIHCFNFVFLRLFYLYL